MARGIRPVMEHRSLWREELERVLEGAGIGNVVYDEVGTGEVTRRGRCTAMIG